MSAPQFKPFGDSGVCDSQEISSATQFKFQT